MGTPTTYFFNPFAVQGDTLPIPTDLQVSGAISYYQGYGPDYELNLLTNPDAIPIGRTTMNQLFLDITTQLQAYSQFGTPFFITTDQNEGTPFSYRIYARVYYSGVVYENQVDENTATPGTDSSWLAISGDVLGIQTGTILDYGGVSAPAGYLPCDGSAVSRSTYLNLMNVIAPIQQCRTTFSSNVITGLTSTTELFVGMSLECANFAPGTTVETIETSTSITASVPASTTTTFPINIQFFNWQNGDGSTTFNVPDLRRKTTIGQGGAGGLAPGVPGSVVGQFGGEETHMQSQAELASHAHAAITGAFLEATGGTGTNNGSSGGPQFATDTFTQNVGSSTPFNIMQPSAITYKMIKT